MEAGDHVDAASRLAEALEVARDLDSQYLIVNLLPSVAALAARVGEDESSARLIGGQATEKRKGASCRPSPATLICLDKL